jgi:alkylated DNA repair dioxygenase AlkB
MHRDSDEHAPDPVVSISLGAPGAGRLNITLRVSGLQPDDRRRGSAVQNERRRGIP